MSPRRLLARLSLLALTVGILTVPSFVSAAASYQIVVHVPGVAGVVPAGAKVTLVDPISSVIRRDSRLIGQDSYGWFGVVDVPAESNYVKVMATGIKSSSLPVDPSNTREIWLSAAGKPYDREFMASGKFRINLVTKGAALLNRGVKVTIGKTVKTYNFSKSGTKLGLTLGVTASTTLVKFTVLRAGKAGATYTADVRKNAKVWVGDFFAGIRTSEAWANNQVKIHYHRADDNYNGWGVHAWSNSTTGGSAQNTDWANPIVASSVEDAWGVTYTVPLKANSKSLPYLIHKGDEKDPSNNDQLLSLAYTKGEIWFESGRVNTNGTMRYTVPVPLDEAPTLPQATTAPTLQEAEALASDSVRSAFAQDNIYFVLTDRYKNGSAANDQMGLTGSRSVTGFDPTSTAYYHGGDFAGLTDGCTTGEGIARLKSMGFTSIWVTPPFKQKYVQGNSAAYHGYWITDFTDIDPHLGTKAEFQDFIDCAHSQGMKVVMDIVINHTGDVNFYPSFDYGFGAPRAASTLASDANLRKPDFLNDLTNYHNRGNVGDWGDKEQYQNGDFFGLDDVATEKSAVIEGFAQVYATWVNDFGIDGFRIDTAKHVDDVFFTKWWPRVLELTANNNPSLFAFGEVYDSNTSTLTQFVRDRALPSVLDFAFQNAAVQFAAGNSIQGVANLFEDDDWYITPKTNAYNQVTFLGNHDMGRFGQLLSWAGDPTEDLWGDSLLGYDLMYLSRGVPSVYYGDEVGIIGSGGDQGARQDLFPTQVSGWKTQQRVAGTAIGTGSFLTETNHPFQERIAALNALRTTFPALASGAQISRYAANSVVAFSRIDKAQRREFLVALNNSKTSKTGVTIQTSSPNTVFESVWGLNQSVTSDANGVVNISVGDRQAVVLRAASTLPVEPALPTITLSLPKDTGVALWKPQVSIANWMDPSTCTFVVRVDGGAWQVLGVDDSPSWKMILDGNKFANGSKITVAAVIKTTSGQVGVSNAIQITNNR